MSDTVSIWAQSIGSWERLKMLVDKKAPEKKSATDTQSVMKQLGQMPEWAATL